MGGTGYARVRRNPSASQYTTLWRENVMNLKQKITLVAFEVDCYDRREAKPRTLHHERVVLNGGRLNALDRLGIRPTTWIMQQFEVQGFAVQQVKKGQSVDAQVDLTALWSKTAAEKALHRLGANVAQIVSGGAARMKYYQEVPGWGRPVFIRKGSSFDCVVCMTLGAVLVTVPPDMSRRQAIKKALALAALADSDYKARAAEERGEA